MSASLKLNAQQVAARKAFRIARSKVSFEQVVKQIRSEKNERRKLF